MDNTPDLRVECARASAFSLLLFLLVNGIVVAEENLPRTFDPQTVVRRRFKPIVDAPAILATEVDGQVSDNDLVLGVEINAVARAYPINMLTGPTREIINDTLGGRAIAATW